MTHSIEEMAAAVEEEAAHFVFLSGTCTDEQVTEFCIKAERLRAAAKALREAQRALDHYDLRSEMYTNDADCAAGIAAILRAVVAPSDQSGSKAVDQSGTAAAPATP